MDTIKAISVLFVAMTLCCATEVRAEDEHWSYGGRHGPAKWAEVDPDFATCKLGKVQSPIDIRGAKAADLPAIQFNYKPSPLKVIDNGHTIQVNYAPGSFITVDGVRYELVQFHFHKPGEERINGQVFDMVVHLVHKDAQGKLAVVAVPLLRGKTNPMIARLWKHMPHEKEHEATVDAVSINAADLLPANRRYFTFEGSLTTPPCSEGVRWFVLKQPVWISGPEIAAFAKLYPMNARPLQAANGREIKLSR